MWQARSSSSLSKQNAQTGYCSPPRELRQQILFAVYSPTSFYKDRTWGSPKQPYPTLQALLNGRKLTAQWADETLRSIQVHYARQKQLIDVATDMQYWLYNLNIIHYELIYDAEYVTEKFVEELEAWREEMERQMLMSYEKKPLPLLIGRTLFANFVLYFLYC